MAHPEGLLNQSMEEQASVARGATVEPEGELVEVVGQVRSFWPALVSAEQPALQERGYAVDAWQQYVGGFVASSDHMLLVNEPGRRQARVAPPAVGDDTRSWGHRFPDEGQQALRRRIGQIVAGPTAGLILADMGADVIKVEPPDAGTPRRPGNLRTGPFFFFNRNKRSLVVDLATAEGHEVALRLIRRADVLIENMAPGTMNRLGLGYGDVHRENPRPVYASLKGYLTGPYQSRPLLDEPAQMATGLAYMTGPPRRPLRAGASVVDIGAANYAVISILAALLERQTTGEGQHVTGGLFETALLYVGQHMAHAQLTGDAPPPMPTVQAGAERRRAAIYELFTCKDDRQVFVAIVSDNQWRRFCSVFGMEELLDDPGLQHNAGRAMEREWLLPRIAGAIAGRDSHEVVDILVRADVTVAPVHTPLSVLEDPHVTSEGRTLPAEIGNVTGRLPALPYESSAYAFSVRRHAPGDPGQDSSEVLRELGYTAQEVDDLARKGIVRGPGLPGV